MHRRRARAGSAGDEHVGVRGAHRQDRAVRRIVPASRVLLQVAPVGRDGAEAARRRAAVVREPEPPAGEGEAPRPGGRRQGDAVDLGKRDRVDDRDLVPVAEGDVEDGVVGVERHPGRPGLSHDRRDDLPGEVEDDDRGASRASGHEDVAVVVVHDHVGEARERERRRRRRERALGAGEHEHDRGGDGGKTLRPHPFEASATLARGTSPGWVRRARPAGFSAAPPLPTRSCPFSATVFPVAPAPPSLALSSRGKASFPGPSKVGGTGLEPVTSCV